MGGGGEIICDSFIHPQSMMNFIVGFVCIDLTINYMKLFYITDPWMNEI